MSIQWGKKTPGLVGNIPFGNLSEMGSGRITNEKPALLTKEFAPISINVSHGFPIHHTLLLEINHHVRMVKVVLLLQEIAKAWKRLRKKNPAKKRQRYAFKKDDGFWLFHHRSPIDVHNNQWQVSKKTLPIFSSHGAKRDGVLRAHLLVDHHGADEVTVEAHRCFIEIAHNVKFPMSMEGKVVFGHTLGWVSSS